MHDLLNTAQMIFKGSLRQSSFNCGEGLHRRWLEPKRWWYCPNKQQSYPAFQVTRPGRSNSSIYIYGRRFSWLWDNLAGTLIPNPLFIRRQVHGSYRLPYRYMLLSVLSDALYH